MNLKVGQKVVCIENANWKVVPGTGHITNSRMPKKGDILVIYTVEMYEGKAYLEFEGLPYDQYISECFRPLDESFAESVLEMIKYANKIEYITFKGYGRSTKKQQREN